MNRVLCIIQARMGSKRLPGKPLLKIGGESLIEIAWKKACEAFGENNVVITTPIFGNSKLWTQLREIGAYWVNYAGDEDDVLGRFYEAVKNHEWNSDTTIFRYTPDDWRKDIEAMKRVAAGETGIPVEIGGEAFTFKQLKEWHETVTDPYLREHIGILINPNPVAPPDDGWPWSVDTEEDLRRANIKTATDFVLKEHAPALEWLANQ